MTDSPAELAYDALETLLTGISGLTGGVTRRLPDQTQALPENMPLLAINETGESIMPKRGFEGMISKQTLHCDLYLYCVNNAPDAVVSTQINNMIYSIRQALAPPSYTPYQTLGDTVSHCWVEGKIEIIEGVQNNQGLAIIPVNILTNF